MDQTTIDNPQIILNARFHRLKKETTNFMEKLFLLENNKRCRNLFMIITKDIDDNIKEMKHPVLLPSSLHVKTEKSKEKYVRDEKKSMILVNDKEGPPKDEKDTKKTKEASTGKGKKLKSEFLKKHFRENNGNNNNK